MISSRKGELGSKTVKPLIDLMKIGGIWFDFSDYKIGFFLKWFNVSRSVVALLIWMRQVAHLSEAGATYLLDESAVFIPIGLVEFFLSVGCIYFTPLTRYIIVTYSKKFEHYSKKPWAKKIIDEEFEVFTKAMTLFKIGLGGFFVFYVIVPIGFDCIRAVLGMEAYVVPLPLNFQLSQPPVRNTLFYTSVAISYLYFLIIVPRFISFGAVVVYCVAFVVTDIKILMWELEKMAADDDKTVFLQKRWDLRNVIEHHSSIVKVMKEQYWFLGFLILAQNLMTSIALCLVLYLMQTTIQKGDLVLAVFCSLFLVYIVLQTVAFNAGSFLIENRSEELMWALYELPWYKQPPNSRKDFNRVIGQAVKLMRISFEGSHVSLIASMRVLNQAYSFFMLINSKARNSPQAEM